jgi:hypothetical protein
MKKLFLLAATVAALALPAPPALAYPGRGAPEHPE